MNKKTSQKKSKTSTSVPVIKGPEHKMKYLPILKGKAGELNALYELSVIIKSQILPVIEVPETPWDYVHDKYAKTITEHIKGFLKKLIDSWGVEYPVIIDTALVGEDKIDGLIVMDYLLMELHGKGIEAIPVVRFDDTEEHYTAVKKHLKDFKRICLRIDSNDINDIDMSAEIPKLLKKLGVEYENVDLVLDLKDLKTEQEKIYANVAKMSINNAIPNIEKFNSFSLAMTSFPVNLSDHNADTMEEIPRAEWNVWNSLIGNQLKRKPTFGDYGISSSELQDVDPRIMQMSASIRYTWQNSWLIVKGRSTKKHGFEQFYALADRLVNSDYYYGDYYSWGDLMIMEKSKRTGGTGNPTTWRAIGTNHHITVVVEQINAIRAS